MSTTYDPREDVIRKAFLLGFKVSREGFNGECEYGHLAPKTLGNDDERGSNDPYYGPELMKLQELAVRQLTPAAQRKGCRKKLAEGQWWKFCGETDMGQTLPALCTECGGEHKLA